MRSARSQHRAKYLESEKYRNYDSNLSAVALILSLDGARAVAALQAESYNWEVAAVWGGA